MSTAIHVNRTEAVCSTGFNNVETLKLGDLEKLCAIGSRDLPCSAGRFTSGVWFLSRLNANSEKASCPGLKWNLTQLGFGCKKWIGGFTRICSEESKVRCDVWPRERNLRRSRIPK